MAVGGYTAAILSARYGMPFWVGLIAGGSMAAVVGTFFGIPSLRIKGLYLAIATLAAQFIIEWAINHSAWISGGVQSTIYVPKPSLGGVLLNSELKKYYMILVVAALAFVFAMNLVRSRVGRALSLYSRHCEGTYPDSYEHPHSTSPEHVPFQSPANLEPVWELDTRQPLGVGS